MRAFDASIRMRNFEREDFVRHDANMTFAGQINCPAEGIAAVLSAARLGKVVRVDKPNIGSLAAVKFDTCHEVTHHQRVLNEELADSLVASRPIHALKGHVQVAPKTPSAARGEAINNASRSTLMIFAVTIPAGAMVEREPGRLFVWEANGAGGVRRATLRVAANGRHTLSVRTMPGDLSHADRVDHIVNVDLATGSYATSHARRWTVRGTRLAPLR